MKDLIALRYPIGNFEYGKKYTIEETRKHIKEIAALPKNLKKAVKKLRDGALDKPYRPQGWTARQVIHHLADSHMNAYIRMKLTVTENTPVVKPYEEQLWAEMEDGKHGSAKLSIKLLSALHERWVQFLSALTEEDLERGFFHPITKRTILLQEAIALYAWHSKHHLAHIKIVASGKAAKAIKDAKNKAKEKTKDTPAPKEDTAAKAAPKASPATPKKRVMSEAHKEKIRAAHAARSATKAAKAAKTAAAAPAKRVRRTKEQIAADNAAKAAAPKLTRAQILEKARAAKNTGAEPKAAKPAKATKAAAAAPAKRVRRTKEQIAADKAAKAAAPKLTRAQILEKARAAKNTGAESKAAKTAAAAPAKRVRRTKEQIAADKAAKAAAPKLTRAQIMEKARAAKKTNEGKTPSKTAEKKTKK